MPWIDDDITPKVKRTVGRPLENPFLSPESEEEFVLRGNAMLERYYRPNGSNTRQDFVFGPCRTMSKTHFWATVFIYYVEEKGMKNNLQGFLHAVQRHFGASVASDRAGIHKNICMQRSLEVTLQTSLSCKNPAELNAQRKYRAMYRFLVNCWEQTLS